MAVNTYRFIIMFIMIGMICSLANGISQGETYTTTTTTSIDTFNNDTIKNTDNVRKDDLFQANPRTEIQGDSTTDMSIWSAITTAGHFLKMSLNPIQILNPLSLSKPSNNVIERSILTTIALIRSFILMMAVIEIIALIRNKKTP